MKIVVTIFAIAALLSGLVSAWHWWFSAFEAPPPTAKLATLIDDETGRTPLDRWIETRANKNREAAGWSGIAIVLATIATLLSVWFPG